MWGFLSRLRSRFVTSITPANEMSGSYCLISCVVGRLESPPYTANRQLGTNDGRLESLPYTANRSGFDYGVFRDNDDSTRGDVKALSVARLVMPDNGAVLNDDVFVDDRLSDLGVLADDD